MSTCMLNNLLALDDENDGGRTTASAEPVAVYELIYQQAMASGNVALAETMCGWIHSAIEAGSYNRSSLPSYSSLGRNDEPLKLLWGPPEIPEPPVPAQRSPRTDRLPFAGITLQRNPSSATTRSSSMAGREDPAVGRTSASTPCRTSRWSRRHFPRPFLQTIRSPLAPSTTTRGTSRTPPSSVRSRWSARRRRAGFTSISSAVIRQ